MASPAHTHAQLYTEVPRSNVAQSTETPLATDYYVQNHREPTMQEYELN